MFKFVLTVFAAVLALTVVSAKPIPAYPLVARSTIFQGQGTFFFQQGQAGACGKVHQDTDRVVALPPTHFKGGSHCGQTITITDTSSGKSQQAVVADLCVGCAGDSIDLSTGVFDQFADQTVGTVKVSWRFG